MSEHIEITAEESGERIDALLARLVPELTRSAAQRLLEEGLVTLGGVPVKKNRRTEPGEVYAALLPEPELPEPEPQDIPLDIVYEDADVVVVNKPRGMVVHPAPGHPDGTLVNALLWHCGASLSGVGGERRPGIVHRIDKDTSGLIIAAKNDYAHLALSAQLADRSLSRVYEAVARGEFREEAGTVDAPIGRHPTERKRMAVTERGSRPAVTHWEVIARYRGWTHIRCRLETGRTHQIRVHLAAIGCPLLGDRLYGRVSEELARPALHSAALTLSHPLTGDLVSVRAPLPEDMRGVLAEHEIKTSEL